MNKEHEFINIAFQFKQTYYISIKCTYKCLSKLLEENVVLFI